MRGWWLPVFLACAPVEKKLIEFGWDEPDPAFMREHAREMERTPFDGCVFHVNKFTWDAWSKKAFTESDMGNAARDLAQAPFRSNFLRFNTTPADIDWFDDFSPVLKNARLAARVAKEGRCAGILFDIEQYNAPLFDIRKRKEKKSWEEVAAQVRVRGREVMEAFQAGFPDLVVFLTFGYCLPWQQSQKGKKPLAECGYGLLAPFMDGLVEGAAGKSKIVDGHELSYPYKDPAKFAEAYRTMREGLLPIVADPKKYLKVVSVGFGIWMDDDWRKKGWNTEDPSKNYFTPEAFEASVRAALAAADEYVWIYTETPRWWSKEGGPVKLPQAYDAALRRAAGR